MPLKRPDYAYRHLPARAAVARRAGRARGDRRARTERLAEGPGIADRGVSVPRMFAKAWGVAPRGHPRPTLADRIRWFATCAGSAGGIGPAEEPGRGTTPREKNAPEGVWEEA